jgi:hypothetical protein
MQHACHIINITFQLVIIYRKGGVIKWFLRYVMDSTMLDAPGELDCGVPITIPPFRAGT